MHKSSIWHQSSFFWNILEISLQLQFVESTDCQQNKNLKILWKLYYSKLGWWNVNYILFKNNCKCLCLAYLKYYFNTQLTMSELPHFEMVDLWNVVDTFASIHQQNTTVVINNFNNNSNKTNNMNELFIVNITWICKYLAWSWFSTKAYTIISNDFLNFLWL